jgi:hypothetical protein
MRWQKARMPTVLELREQRKTQFYDLTNGTQLEQSGPMGLEAHGLGVFGAQIEEAAPGIGKDL